MLIDKLHDSISSRLAVIDFNATVEAAALLLSRPGIGLVVVCNASGCAEGVLSKSDLIRHLTSPTSSVPRVAALMTRSIISCSPEDDVHAVWQTMAALDLQNIPVIDVGAKPLGILDIRDAMKALFKQEEIQEKMLLNYVSGVGYR
jgi:CBS domain-containing protein